MGEPARPETCGFYSYCAAIIKRLKEKEQLIEIFFLDAGSSSLAEIT